MGGPAVTDPLAEIEQGHRLAARERYAKAEACFRRALGIDPGLAMAHNNLGWVRKMQGDLQDALSHTARALELNPNLDLARANLAALLSENGRFVEAKPLWDELLRRHLKNPHLWNDANSAAIEAGDLATTGEYAARNALAFRGSRWHCAPQEGIPVPAELVPAPMLTPGKLRHDIEQFSYLQACGTLGPEFSDVVRNYRQVLHQTVAAHGERAQVALDPEQKALIGDSYGRIVHVRPTPRVAGSALAAAWQVGAEDAYLRHPLGLVVVDDFLRQPALESLRQFCLQSTVWLGTKYAHGRLAAAFREGFSCPLLMQIAEELRQAFPRIIGHEQRLLQLWGFKYGQSQPAIRPHADFAAVNVNFWLTPDEANLDKGGAGLTVYDVEAPLDWDFGSYNGGGQKISDFLAKNKARALEIPYRANRAVIFNSDLFHTTTPFHFAPGYHNRRVNVTMLFGRRG